MQGNFLASVSSRVATVGVGPPAQVRPADHNVNSVHTYGVGRRESSFSGLQPAMAATISDRAPN